MSLLYEAVLVLALCFVATGLFVAVCGDSRAEPLRGVLQIFLLIVTGTYFVGSWTGGRRTLPMRTWGIRLVDRTGHPLNRKLATARFLLAIVGVCAGGTGFLWAILDRERLFLHDRLVGSRLVQDR